MFDMILPTCSRDEKGAWHFAWSVLGVFEADVDETDLSLRWGGGWNVESDTSHRGRDSGL